MLNTPLRSVCFQFDVLFFFLFVCWPFRSSSPPAWLFRLQNKQFQMVRSSCFCLSSVTDDLLFINFMIISQRDLSNNHCVCDCIIADDFTRTGERRSLSRLDGQIANSHLVEKMFATNELCAVDVQGYTFFLSSKMFDNRKWSEIIFYIIFY